MTVMNVKGRTTSQSTSFDQYSLSSNSLIYTTATDSNVEDFSLELTLGNGWNENYSNSNKNMLLIDEKITIPRRGSIVVEVAEDLRMPHNRYGVVLPTGSMFLTLGIMVAPAKVEPAFNGRLKLRLFNTTNSKVSILKGTKLASVVIFATESTMVHDSVFRLSEISDHPPVRFFTSKLWIKTYHIQIIGWLLSFVTSSLVTLGVTYFLYYKPMLERAAPVVEVSAVIKKQEKQ
jgi:Deoxycytidine deaminase